MSKYNVDFALPSGAKVTRQEFPAGMRGYYVWSGNGHLARLTVDDIEHLYADAIAPTGGYHSRQHLEAALTWIERNLRHGVQFVARALSESAP